MDLAQTLLVEMEQARHPCRGIIRSPHSTPKTNCPECRILGAGACQVCSMWRTKRAVTVFHTKFVRGPNKNEAKTKEDDGDAIELERQDDSHDDESGSKNETRYNNSILRAHGQIYHESLFLFYQLNTIVFTLPVQLEEWVYAMSSHGNIGLVRHVGVYQERPFRFSVSWAKFFRKWRGPLLGEMFPGIKSLCLEFEVLQRIGPGYEFSDLYRPADSQALAEALMGKLGSVSELRVRGLFSGEYAEYLRQGMQGEREWDGAYSQLLVATARQQYLDLDERWA